MRSCLYDASNSRYRISKFPYCNTWRLNSTTTSSEWWTKFLKGTRIYSVGWKLLLLDLPISLVCESLVIRACERSVMCSDNQWFFKGFFLDLPLGARSCIFCNTRFPLKRPSAPLSAPAQVFSGMSANRSAPAHPIICPLGFVFRSAYMLCLCSLSSSLQGQLWYVGLPYCESETPCSQIIIVQIAFSDDGTITR